VTREKIEGKWNKEMEKRNFIRWYRNANHEEIEKVNGEGKRILERLLIEYTDEIEMINKSKYQTNLSPSQI
jgi:Holliday junction resolvasome RuvABC DNA-binding subunit